MQTIWANTISFCLYDCPFPFFGGYQWARSVFSLASQIHSETSGLDPSLTAATPLKFPQVEALSRAHWGPSWTSVTPTQYRSNHNGNHKCWKCRLLVGISIVLYHEGHGVVLNHKNTWYFNIDFDYYHSNSSKGSCPLRIFGTIHKNLPCIHKWWTCTAVCIVLWGHGSTWDIAAPTNLK